MIRFTNKPDTALTEVLNRMISDAICTLEDAIEDKTYEDIDLYFNKEIVNMFGGEKTLLSELKRLDNAPGRLKELLREES